jgi:hypothetical protein
MTPKPWLAVAGQSIAGGVPVYFFAENCRYMIGLSQSGGF